MAARWLAFVIWAAVAASALFWALRLFVRPLPTPPHTTTVNTAAAVRGDLTRLFGAEAAAAAEGEAAPAPSPESTRFQLVGVVAPRGAAGGGGLALIAVDGKPAKAFRVGTAVEGETVLQSVGLRNAALGTRGAPATIALEIPALPPPATGSLPGIQNNAAAPGIPAARSVAPGMPPAGNVPAPRPAFAPQGVVQPAPQQAPQEMPQPQDPDIQPPPAGVPSR